MKASKSLGILAASAVLFSGAAEAVTLTAGQAATIQWSGTYAGAALSASATFQLTSINSTTAVVNVSVVNSTLSSEPGTNRLTAFAIDNITPNVNIGGISISQDLSDDDDWHARRAVNFPGFQSVELCMFAGSTCAGGSNGGLIEGESDSFVLTLLGSFGDSLTFEGFPSKWQAVGVNSRSFEFGGCVVGECGGSVPEPGPLALFGVGLLGLALRQRRKAN